MTSVNSAPSDAEDERGGSSYPSKVALGFACKILECDCSCGTPSSYGHDTFHQQHMMLLEAAEAALVAEVGESTNNEVLAGRRDEAVTDAALYTSY